MSVALFQDLIAGEFLLERRGAKWIVVETHKDAANKEVGIVGCQMLVFSLDQTELNSLPFIKDNTNKRGMRSVCDAMIVASFNDKTYFCALDMKSGKASNARKQIESARHLFIWLLGLAKLHGHWVGEFNDDCFFGIIHLAPRKQEAKGTTRRDTQVPKPAKSHWGDYRIFTLPNHPTINLSHIIARL
ncbi:MAG: hypothetical protein RL748_446 [Pseudomonadota bacterium]|jgi:hypothetical protein